MRTRGKFITFLTFMLVFALTMFSIGFIGQAQVDSSITLEKTVSKELVYAGTEVTYTYKVTNTGSTEVTGITIEDSQLGTITELDDLGPGESLTHEVKAKITEDTTNVATAVGVDSAGNSVESTSRATVEVKVPEVYLDVKPTSCPNPLNIWSKGVLPVAILGSEHLDVQESVDEKSVTLEGIKPIRHSYEDVAELYGSSGPEDCSTGGPDGYMDLVFKFETQRLVEELDGLDSGGSVELNIEGTYKGLYDGETFSSSDYVVILNGGRSEEKASDKGKN